MKRIITKFFSGFLEFEWSFVEFGIIFLVFFSKDIIVNLKGCMLFQYRHRETSYDARSKKLLEVSKTGEITIETLQRQRDALELRFFSVCILWNKCIKFLI